MECRAPEVLLCGPAGTGKSRACLEKLYAAAARYPGMRALIARKTRASLTESALVTLEQQVLPTAHPALEGPSRATRRCYRLFEAEILVGGLDRPTRILSTEFDLIYVQEAIELTEHDWEVLSTRLRHGRMPYQQLLADTNPAGPTHWLKRRADRGQTVLLEARHEDNPRLWNGREWTVEGVRYLERLAGLSGARLQRLGYGRWVQAEGIVYEEWDGAVHLVDGGAIRAEWPRLWSIDFGFTNPNVWQEWALDPDRRLYLAREHVRTGELPGELAALLRRAGTRPLEAVCDHDAAGRAELEKLLQIRTRPAFKEVLAGIQAVKARLRPAADGRPRLFVARGCLLGRDPRMDERREPIGLAEEIDVYRWREDGGRDEPVPEHDHSMDAMRYAVAWTDNLGRREMRVY